MFDAIKAENEQAASLSSTELGDVRPSVTVESPGRPPVPATRITSSPTRESA